MLTRLKDYLVTLYLREPARSNAAIVAIVLAIAGTVGVVVSAPLVLAVVTLAAPFIVAELTRPRVTPDVVVAGKVVAAYEQGAATAQRAADNAGIAAIAATDVE